MKKGQIIVRPCFEDFRLVSLQFRTKLGDKELVPGFSILTKKEVDDLISNEYTVVFDGMPTETSEDDY